MTLHPLRREHLPATLALNAAHETETGPLTHQRLAQLVEAASLALGVGGGAEAFLLVFDEAAPYDSPHFLWHRERQTEPFLYVDRIVVAPSARGRGIARRLYEGTFAHARATDRALIACEINVEPPNLGSDAFHAALGFEEVGRASARGKTVRYMIKRL